MKKYPDLGTLLLDYRKAHDMTQIDLAAMLDVDSRTVARWERNVTLVHPEKEKFLVQQLSIPHQVIHNLNSERPIAVFYDIERRMYSHSIMGSLIKDANWFKNEIEVEEDRLTTFSSREDADFVHRVKALHTHLPGLDIRILQEAANRLPELNLMLDDQSGFYAGQIAVLPLRMSSYLELRDRKRTEEELRVGDLSMNPSEGTVFYFYSLYADSMVSAFYLMSRFFGYFRKMKFNDYTISGIVYREHTAHLWRQTGMKILWQDENPHLEILVEGNLDMYLFGSMN
ncbi:helix-turn-helix domain-containing protein [Aureitalea marina]|uniref:HTH cro/C1-type domain-containing protein n=1 Tax=Aureitalea marina TaxID=930804 RepID=A0A2S7KNN3_9FLAO|nr:helix-turn-helix transcriptional regulator [Aureitalea marina]PQB04183.1 hypothetical protein BST85_04150 [Aureitalea marina]